MHCNSLPEGQLGREAVRPRHADAQSGREAGWLMGEMKRMNNMSEEQRKRHQEELQLRILELIQDF
jgi:hypothetical protein